MTRAAPEEARILEPGNALTDREFTHLASSETSKGLAAYRKAAASWLPAPRRLRRACRRHGTDGCCSGDCEWAEHTRREALPACWALDPLDHRIEELHPLLLQTAQHVFGDGWKSFADQNVKAERRQRPAVEGFGARRLLFQRLLRRVLPGDDTEAGALECGPGRLRRKQKADALVARPRRRVIRLASGTGRDVLQRQASAGLEHTTHLAIEAITVGDVHRRVLRPHDVEARVGKRQVERVSLPVGDLVGEPSTLCKHSGERDEFRSQVEAVDLAAELAGEIARGSADAAADVEHALGAVDLRQLCQPYGRIAPARMELIDRREVVRRQVLDIFSRFLQRPQDDVAEGASPVVVGDDLC